MGNEADSPKYVDLQNFLNPIQECNMYGIWELVQVNIMQINADVHGLASHDVN